MSLPVRHRVYAAQEHEPGVRRGVPLTEKEKPFRREVAVDELHNGEYNETDSHDDDVSIERDCQRAPDQYL
jgi:hypothetical protein